MALCCPSLLFFQQKQPCFLEVQQLLLITRRKGGLVKNGTLLQTSTWHGTILAIIRGPQNHILTLQMSAAVKLQLVGVAPIAALSVSDCSNAVP